MATWVAIGSGATTAQMILGPETNVGAGLAINVGILMAALFMVFRAGTIFKIWLDAINSALQFAQVVEKMQRDMVRLEEELARTQNELDRQIKIVEHINNRLYYPVRRAMRNE